MCISGIFVGEFSIADTTGKYHDETALMKRFTSVQSANWLEDPLKILNFFFFLTLQLISM
jgi:hypothetical protein